MRVGPHGSHYSVSPSNPSSNRSHHRSSRTNPQHPITNPRLLNPPPPSLNAPLLHLLRPTAQNHIIAPIQIACPFLIFNRATAPICRDTTMLVFEPRRTAWIRESALAQSTLDFVVIVRYYLGLWLYSEGVALTLLGEDGTDEAGDVEGLGFDL